MAAAEARSKRREYVANKAVRRWQHQALGHAWERWYEQHVKLVKMKGEIIGFVIGIPSLSEAMQNAGGSLFPFGFLHILSDRKGKEVLDQMLTGVRKEHMATGAGVVLMAELQKQMLAKGMRYIETTGIFETNQNAIANWKNYEHIQHKRKRVYHKLFS